MCFYNFCDVAKVVIIPQEDLAQFGYNLNMTVLKCYASFCNLATAGTYHRNMAIFFFFFCNSGYCGPFFSLKIL
jgi:hypothetical protein